MKLTTEARFAGVWSVVRDIADHAGERSGRFRGLARITPDGAGLRYAEQGLLTLGAARLTASRAYLWRPGEGRLVRVLFEDGRPFHSFDWGLIESRDSHLCGEDRYELRYSFAAESWHAHCRVTGPRKDYTSSARYLRALAGDRATP